MVIKFGVNLKKMNITNLTLDLQKQSRKCFESFKNDYLHYPLKDKLTKDKLLEFAIYNSITISFRGRWMNKYVSSDLSKEQLKFFYDKLEEYRNLTKKVAINWSKRH